MFLCGTVFLFTVCSQTTTGNLAEQPNIILIMADDLGQPLPSSH
jgi:hypothetical protein